MRAKETDAVARTYDRLAEAYDTRWSFYVEATLRETLARLHLPPRCRVLDLGCGTGSLLAGMAARWPSAQLVGLDLSGNMLQVARTKLHAGIPLMLADALRLPYKSAIFDVVLCCNAFHYWRTPEQGLSEIARVLRPGGEVVITDWCDDYLMCRICNVFLRIFNRAHYQTYGGAECRKLLGHSGFETHALDRYKISWLWGMMTAKARVPVHTDPHHAGR